MSKTPETNMNLLDNYHKSLHRESIVQHQAPFKFNIRNNLVKSEIESEMFNSHLEEKIRLFDFFFRANQLVLRSIHSFYKGF